MGLLDAKTAIVTGGASGLGEATCRPMVAEGARVVVADIQDDKGHAVADDLGNDARYEHVDVTSEDEVHRRSPQVRLPRIEARGPGDEAPASTTPR